MCKFDPFLPSLSIVLTVLLGVLCYKSEFPHLLEKLYVTQHYKTLIQRQYDYLNLSHILFES